MENTGSHCGGAPVRIIGAEDRSPGENIAEVRAREAVSEPVPPEMISARLGR
jgi:hypothetical protein